MDKVLRFARPLHASEECLRCHANAQSGDVLGVLTVTSVDQMLRSAIKAFQRDLLLVDPSGETTGTPRSRSPLGSASAGPASSSLNSSAVSTHS